MDYNKQSFVSHLSLCMQVCGRLALSRMFVRPLSSYPSILLTMHGGARIRVASGAVLELGEGALIRGDAPVSTGSVSDEGMVINGDVHGSALNEGSSYLPVLLENHGIIFLNPVQYTATDLRSASAVAREVRIHPHRHPFIYNRFIY